MRRAWLALILLLAGCVAPETPAGAPDCRVARVVDGDTVDLACRNRGTVRARLLGYDTPEVTEPQCRAEAVAGQQATGHLRRIVRSGPVTAAGFRGQDRYGRDLVRLEIAGQDVARTMIATGLARPYHGGPRPGWCARSG